MKFPTLTSQLLTLAAVLAALPSQAAVTQTVKREFDQLGRLAKVIQADGSWEGYGYDPNGNRIYSFDQLDRVTRYEYDSFNRLVAITDPQRKVTKMAYDGRGNLVKVTDPRGLTTEYQYNGFNELVKQISPDTGTSTQTRETHGRVTSHTNAAGQTTQFTYDPFGRLIAQAHQGGPNWTFQRDSLGRLIEVTDAAGTTRYSYDGQSRLQSKTQQIGSLTQTVGYRWNAANRLAGITTPSGRVIDYTRQNGQIVSINLDGQPLLTQVVYQPLGAIQGWTWANGLHHTRLYDANGRLYRFESAGIIAKRLVFDSASNVEKLEDLQNTAGTQRFGYDRLDRLTSETATNRTDVYQYDDNGNRTRVTRNGTQTASQIDPASNRLTALASQTRTYTATGHLQSDGTRTFEYDGAERLVKVTTNGKTYAYQHNAWGERLGKPGVRFVYDEEGRLLGEYTADGNLIQETVWLGDLPIATIRPNPTSSSQTQVYYVHPDHLGSPRAVSDPISNQAVWRWDSDVFGQGTPEEDPDQDKQKFVYNLRFPGQYFDQETGLNYNFFRDYDPATGRYVQSDPIGLNGGLNTYAYVFGNPVGYSDPFGLLPKFVEDSPVGTAGRGWGGAAAYAYAVATDNVNMEAAAVEGMAANHSENVGALFELVTQGRGLKLKQCPPTPKNPAPPPFPTPGKFKKGVTNPEVSKLEKPSVPPEFSRSAFGKDVIKWGVGGPGAAERIKNVTAQDVQKMMQQGLTRDMAREWRDFYANDFARNANNIAAQNRSVLMQKIMDLM